MQQIRVFGHLAIASVSWTNIGRLAGFCVCIFCSPARADDLQVQRTTYGDVGLLEMPSSRMAPDGQLAASIGALGGTQRYSLSFQALPWLEGTFRYSHIANYQGPGDPLYDRSLGFKIRLSQEGDYLPAISIGARDILGTGVYGAEYLVASKQFGPFDLTLGTGWGRLAESDALPNPLAKIFPSFATRQDQANPTGGTIDSGALFHGPDIGVFGGVDWHTPLPALDVVVEYSSDRYLAERPAGFQFRSPINIGLTYRPYDNVQVTAGWFYGSTYGLTLSFNTDPTSRPPSERIGPTVPEAVIRDDTDRQNALTALLQGREPSTYIAGPARANTPASGTFELQQALYNVGNVRDYQISAGTLIINSGDFRTAADRCDQYAQVAVTRGDISDVVVTNLDDNVGEVKICPVNRANQKTVNADTKLPGSSPAALTARLKKDLLAQDIEMIAVSPATSEITLYYINDQYSLEDEAAGRITRVLMDDLPTDVEIFHLIPLRNNMPMAEIRIVRSVMERAITAYSTSTEMGGGLEIGSAPATNPALSAAWRDISPNLHWDLGPGLQFVFFDPSTPMQFQVFVHGSLDLELAHHLNLNLGVDGNVFNNLDTERASNSVLPHVRTDINEYFKYGASGIRTLNIDYTSRLGQDLYGEFKAGILEEMFSGVGGQILWRPDNGRWAFGLDGYEVRQRDFYEFFGLQSYQTFTGHVSVYYQAPWYGLNFAVHAGRYLAKDVGATFEVSRRFQSGVEIGAFATLTNVPFSKFGEGSFDKGLYIRIPFEWAVPVYTRSAYELYMRSITRDGGARLEGDDALYRELIDSSGPELNNHIDEILQPGL